MLEFAATYQRAVGLAANQCAVKGERLMARMFALRDIQTKQWSIIVDPIITSKSGLLRKKIEGCLTWPGNNILAERYFKVEVSYRDSIGNPHKKVITGFEAQIWQHEINHLDGFEEEIVDPDFRLPREAFERNDKCPCGSEMKYKQCCIGK